MCTYYDLARGAFSDGLGTTARALINRHALVHRHHPTLRALDPLSPFSVGNGEFAFTADITGLQSFPARYEAGMPLHTQSQWGWHSFPNPQNFQLEDTFEMYEVNGRQVPYACQGAHASEMSEPATYLRANPHRLDLGRIGFVLSRSDGSPIEAEVLENIEQTLNLWRGRLDSHFRFEGVDVLVTTLCHPDRDVLAVRIESAGLANGQIVVRLTFPYGRGDWKCAADWEQPNAHQTMAQESSNGCEFVRVLDNDYYFARLNWMGRARLERAGAHEYELWPLESEFEFTLEFSPEPVSSKTPSFEATCGSAQAHWEKFWTAGAAIDLSQSRDPRAGELERRVVLSQYVTAINCAGSVPPQETGLVCNSWFGKFHLEMHPWHTMHFALWNRLSLLERSLGWYCDILPQARENARRQGYRGARWPKMVAVDGQDSPSPVAVFLIWQQPHPLYFAELCYRQNPTPETLERYRDIVFETAEFMASYAVWDEAGGRYVLGPALIPAQESYGRDRRTNLNPTYELAYWHWALGIANQWRERCGWEREATWDHVRDHLAKPLVRAGIYEAIETPPYTLRHDHPSMLGAYGLLPLTPLIDTQTMARTLESVVREWNWESTWGWDYPMMAMTAARLGCGDLAIDTLLLDSPKNGYLPNGHNYQAPRLPLYLPGNGGLLAAIAMMAGGWDGAPDLPAPGFPQDGSWTVLHEGLVPMP